MANEHQYKSHTRIVATRGVQEYRETIPVYVKPDDMVLELGCEWGTTTELLAKHCSFVLGTDVSLQCIERARVMRPHLQFAVLDAFDVRAACNLGFPFNKIYLDLSGLSSYRALLDVISLANMYATMFQPDTIVIKSGSLKRFASLCTAWQSGDRFNPSSDCLEP